MHQNDKTDTINKVTSMPDGENDNMLNNNTETATIGPSYSDADGIIANIKEGSISNIEMKICIENSSEDYFYSFGDGNATILKESIIFEQSKRAVLNSLELL